MGIDRSGRDNHLLGRNDLRIDANGHVFRDAGHDVRVPSLADADDEVVLDANVCLKCRGGQ